MVSHSLRRVGGIWFAMGVMAVLLGARSAPGLFVTVWSTDSDLTAATTALLSERYLPLWTTPAFARAASSKRRPIAGGEGGGQGGGSTGGGR